MGRDDPRAIYTESQAFDLNSVACQLHQPAHCRVVDHEPGAIPGVAASQDRRDAFTSQFFEIPLHQVFPTVIKGLEPA
jgi:hypothetical protein